MGRRPENGEDLERKLLDKVSSLLKELGLVQRPQPLIVAVSGGPDSLALLLLLAQLQQPLGVGLHVAHLDHGLRGVESQRDAQFVEKMTRQLNLPITLENLDVESYRATHRLSLEEAAREVRYAFFSRVAHAQGASAVALGHTAEDQVETILMHLLRGSGLVGLVGMSSLSHWPSPHHPQRIALVRPLLKVGREETESFCRWKGVLPRKDSSNLSLRYTRNRIRLDLLPRLNSYNPRFRDALLRLHSSVAQAQEYIAAEALGAMARLASTTKEGIKVERKGFSELHPAMKQYLLRLSYEQLQGTSLGLEHRHIEEMMKLSQGGTGKQVNLPDGLIFSVGYRFLRLSRGGDKATIAPVLQGEYPLVLPGSTRIPGGIIRASLSGMEGLVPHGDPHIAQLNAERIGLHLHIRGRREGDLFQPLGMEKSKKLQDFMVDAKVPRPVRGRIPLVESEKGIAWVVGYQVAHWARLTADTARVLTLRFSPNELTSSE